MISELGKGEEIRTARKQWDCDQCSNKIEIGENYIFGSRRIPQYDEKDKQIGIYYSKYRVHDTREKCRCKDKPCEFTSYPPYSDHNGYFEGVEVCDNCTLEREL